MNVLDRLPPEEEFYRAAEKLAMARTAFSEAFLRHKVGAKTGITDGEANHRAYLDAGVERDLAEAKLEIARTRLFRTEP